MIGIGEPRTLNSFGGDRNCPWCLAPMTATDDPIVSSCNVDQIVYYCPAGHRLVRAIAESKALRRASMRGALVPVLVGLVLLAAAVIAEAQGACQWVTRVGAGGRIQQCQICNYGSGPIEICF